MIFLQPFFSVDVKTEQVLLSRYMWRVAVVQEECYVTLYPWPNNDGQSVSSRYVWNWQDRKCSRNVALYGAFGVVFSVDLIFENNTIRIKSEMRGVQMFIFTYTQYNAYLLRNFS